METRNRKYACVCIALIISQFAVFVEDSVAAGSIRETIDLSLVTWYARLDGEAAWKNDKLFLPSEVDLSIMPVRAPGFGWEQLYKSKEVRSHLPVSMEQLFSEGINSYTYHGVSWLWSEVEVPASWNGKHISFDVEKARMRIEIYINEKLAGYDLIAETPYSVNVADKLNYGEKNRIAIRLTNPGGQRGWADFPAIGWGKYRFPASHDFSGVGHINLVAKNPIHVSDVFVKTLPPITKKTVQIATTIENGSSVEKQVHVQMEFLSIETGKKIHSANWKEAVKKGSNEIVKTIKLNKALPWDIDNPNLYVCRVTLKGPEIRDEYDVRFGMRTFEIKKRDGNPSFYVNGKRIRFRSAIDWGYYAHTGFYATRRQAMASVDAAKEIGHNMISFHRRIGEPEVLNYADIAGLYLYEEPGGFRANGQGDCVPEGTFTAGVMLEKVRRMVLRDRNHPSLIWYTLANEDPSFNPVRKQALVMVNELDNSRLVCNSSGWGKIENILPYDSIITNDYVDDHTVEEHKGFIGDRIPVWGEELPLYNKMLEETERRDRSSESESRFRETDFFSHQKQNDSCLLYWGEVRCFTGPPNWYKAAEMQKDLNYRGYDMNIYRPMADKLMEFYNAHDFPNTGSKNIQSPADLSVQAGKGLMYIDGRLEQIIMSNDLNDGFAINGWTSGPQLPLVWESAILDEAHNLKGPGEEFSHWNKTNQVAIFRQNGKYFRPGDTIHFKICLINEAVLKQGIYQLDLCLKDGNGDVVKEFPAQNVEVPGGETFAQTLIKQFSIIAEKDWKAGYITLMASLSREDTQLCSGSEQVLLQNRQSYYDDFKDLKGLVFNWKPAEQAIKETGAMIESYHHSAGKVDYILGGTIVQNNGGLTYYGPVRHDPPPTFLWNTTQSEDVLRRVKEDGTTLVLNFNEKWAAWLFEQGILSEVPLAFSHDKKMQTKYWDGNGWGYIDHFCGNQSIPAGTTIGTSGWEPPSNPAGFYPFSSEYPTKVYGAYFENGGKIRVLIGEVQYGNGSILLSRTYTVNADHAFNDMLFYNMILMSTGEK